MEHHCLHKDNTKNPSIKNIAPMKVGNNINSQRGSWNFGGNVPDIFVEHVRQSVPFYDAGHDLICYLSDFFCSGEGVCYEIGVSTGQLINKLALFNKNKPSLRWIGIEIHEEMVEKARDHCRGNENIEVYCEDALLFNYERADFVVSYYTMQFIPERHRQELCDKIYEILNKGGAFVLFEKVRAEDARFQDIMVSLYNDFKIRQGFTADEILNKALSLRGVLNPYSSKMNMQMLRNAGFKSIITIMKYICFEGIIAIK